MKNNLLNLNSLKSFNIDGRLQNHNDFLELVIMDKIEEGDFPDITDQMMTIVTDYDNYDDDNDDDDEEEEEEDDYDEGDDYSDPDEDTYAEMIERLKEELRMESERSNRFLQAGYANCMDEAIRFLVEEENISPEHPIVKNLKAHLEKSKDRILETFPPRGQQEVRSADGGLVTTGSGLNMNSRMTGNVQNCRDFG